MGSPPHVVVTRVTMNSPLAQVNLSSRRHVVAPNFRVAHCPASDVPRRRIQPHGFFYNAFLHSAAGAGLKSWAAAHQAWTATLRQALLPLSGAEQASTTPTTRQAQSFRARPELASVTPELWQVAEQKVSFRARWNSRSSHQCFITALGGNCQTRCWGSAQQRSSEPSSLAEPRAIRAG